MHDEKALGLTEQMFKASAAKVQAEDAIVALTGAVRSAAGTPAAEILKTSLDAARDGLAVIEESRS
jgi:hypothetical protein